MRFDWTRELHVRWSPDGSQILFNGPPPGLWNPVALYSVDSAGLSLQKIVNVPDFYEAIDRYSLVADGVRIREIVDVPGRDPVWGDGSSMMYFDIFPDGSKIVYSTCAYTREELGREVTDEWLGINRSMVVSSFDETGLSKEVEHGTSWVYNYEIVLSDIDGTNTKRLTENTHFDNFPTVSPDGTRVAFISNPVPPEDVVYSKGDRLIIHTVSTGKSKEIALPEDVKAIPHPLKWSPDGEYIAFVAYARSNPEYHLWTTFVYVVGADGSGLTRITHAASGPAWSPDGQRIAVAEPRGPGKAHLYTVAADGSDPVLINDNLPDPWSYPESPWVGDLTWSPDATEILFKGFGYGVPLDGSRPVYYRPPRFTDDPDSSSRSGTIFDAAWSPDGSKIAIRDDKYAYGRKDKNSIVFIQDRDGTNIRALVEVVEPLNENKIRLTNEER